MRMIDGDVQGLHRRRPEPGRRLGQRDAAAQGAAQPRLARGARPRRDRDRVVLVRQPGDRGRRGARRGHRHRGLLPARRRAHREGRHASPTPSGCCSGTTRRSSRPATAARSCGSPTTSAAGSASKLRGSTDPTRPAAPRRSPGTTRLQGPHDEPRRRGGAAGDQRPQGRRRRSWRSTRSSPTTARRPAARGSTPGIYADGVNQTARKQAAHRAELDRARVGLGVAGRTAASSTTAPRPTRTASRGPSASATSGGTPSEGSWTSLRRRPRLRARQARRTTCPPEGAKGMDAIRGDDAVHRPPRRARLALRADRASSTARCRRTTSRTSRRSPTRSTTSGANPTRQRFDRPGQPLQPERGEPGADVFPFVDDHLPADRAPHRGRHVAHRAVPVRAAARDVRRGQPGAGRASAGSSTAAGRRSSPRARRSRRA